MTYIVKVTLQDDTIKIFQYEADDTISAIIAFQNDTSPDAIYAREHSKNIEVDKA